MDKTVSRALLAVCLSSLLPAPSGAQDKKDVPYKQERPAPLTNPPADPELAVL